ncbi:MAG: hypothetical protein WBC83_03345 [Minisyncoccia bacterium]
MANGPFFGLSSEVQVSMRKQGKWLYDLPPCPMIGTGASQVEIGI